MPTIQNMHNRGLTTLLDYLRRSVPLPGADTVSDGDLLARFIAVQDQAAFELLVRRHGPMVFGVARRMVKNEHSAEDVLQATFLALARQAKSLRRNANVAGWLYRVAIRISQRACKPVPVLTSIGPYTIEPLDDLMQTELRSELDSAIDRLPDKLRRTVMHCYVLGHTTEEAARLLDCPKGTVLSRLAAAREKLQADLTRKGIVVSTATLTAALTSEMTSAALPATLVALAMKVVGPAAVLTPIVITLAQGAVAMSWTKMVLTTVAVIATGFGATFAINRDAGQDKPVNKSEPAPRVALDQKNNELEDAIYKQVHMATDRRVELKVKISLLQRRVADMKEALSTVRSMGVPSNAGWQTLLTIDPEYVKTIVRPEQIGPAPLIKKVITLLEEAERDLIKTEEELRMHDELSTIRLDQLKRKLALNP